MKRASIYELSVPKIVGMAGKFSSSEEIVRLANQGWDLGIELPEICSQVMGTKLPPEVKNGGPRMQSIYQTATLFSVVARTAALHLLPDEAITDVDDLADWMGDFPPLPFKRCTFERANGAPWMFPGDIQVPALAIVEEVRGTRWSVISYCTLPDEEDGSPGRHAAMVWTIEAGGTIRSTLTKDMSEIVENPTHGVLAMARGLPLSIAHFVTARGVETVASPWPRAMVREHKRKKWPIPPAPYVVRIADRKERVYNGNGERQVGCRFLVRGHYRRAEHGPYWVEAKRSNCLWIESYIKGPPGAPWKGRPVYNVEPRKGS